MGPIICRVKKKSEVMKVTTSKGEQLSKCFIVLKEFGNDYTDEFACSVLGTWPTWDSRRMSWWWPGFASRPTR